MLKIPAKPQAMKRVNCTIIKQILKNNGSATKAEISEAAGLSSTTVRSLLNELLKDKEIVSLGLDESSGGRRAERYTLNIKDNYALAVYISEKYIDYAITDPLDEIVENNRIDTSCKNSIDAVCYLVESLMKSNITIKAIGISAPGIVDRGKYIKGRKLDEWNEFNIGEILEDKYKIPVVLENDLNSIALGFSLNLMKKLCYDDMSILNMIYIHFTENGVGAGIISNGMLIHGNCNFAGELGFMPVCNGVSLNNVLEEHYEDEIYSDIVARTIATVNCITNPSFIVIGGEIFKSQLMDKIKERCTHYINEDVLPQLFLAENSREDCLAGIAYLTIEHMYSGVKLIDNTK